jgi:hypothetical protein
MCKSQSCGPSYETHIELAVAVFKTQDRGLVTSLKNFLTLLPSSQCLEDVLKLALCQSAVSDPKACRWILNNAACIEPELDVIHFVLESVMTQLQSQGLVLNQDFWLGSDSQIHWNIPSSANALTEDLSDRSYHLQEMFIYFQNRRASEES